MKTTVKIGTSKHVLGKRIGRGGEGEVFLIEGRNDRAIKIYKDNLRKNRKPKVQAMIASRIADKTDLVAFPSELVTDTRNAFVGFSMRLVSGYQALHELYSPKSRRRSFPKADYRFLVRTALNVARAVAKVHQTGCVIGDFNHSGVLISDKATVAIIDADSFQFSLNGKSFPCLVGVPDFTPPELHGVNLSTAERSKLHDNFGLAVAIFHLLAMGKHPYAGRHTGADLSLDEAIAQNRFAFSLKRKHETKTSPPPGSINLDDWPPPLSAAFEAAFGTEPKKRPDAAAWVALLKELETKLSRCSMVKTHYYPANAKSCVWCRLSSQSGVDMFPEDFNPDQTINNTGTFDIEKIWASISSVPLPDPQSFLPTVSGNNLAVSETVSKAKSEQLTNKIISALMVAGAIGGLIYTSVWLIVWLALGLYGLVKFSDQTTDFTKFTKAFADADANARTAELAFLSRIGLTELYELHSNLERWTAEYRQLDDSLAREIMQLKSSREARQRADFLDRFPIRRAKINGLGPAKTATLASFGIETAADVTKRAVLNVPGFGESMTSKMLSWRKRHEAKFKYNRAPNASDLRAENAVRSASAVKRAQLALKISGGFSKYRMLQGQPKVRSSTQDTVLLSALERRDSAARDLKALGREVPNSEPIILTPEVKTKTKSNRFPSRPTRSSSNSPSCPKCGATMRRRTARRGVRAGNRFWGCSNYPSCRGTRN